MMRRCIPFFLLLLIHTSAPCQQEVRISAEQLAFFQRFDSISRSGSYLSHFANVYMKATERAFFFFAKYPPDVQQFMQTLEIAFARQYFQNLEEFQSGKGAFAAWRFYYDHPNMTPTQSILAGINAHINSDLWQAIALEFTIPDIKKNRRYFMAFHREMKKIYRDIYAGIYAENRKLRTISQLTAGMDRRLGEWMLFRWRKKQYKLAIQYQDALFSSKKWIRRSDRNYQKLFWINNMVLKHF